MRPRSVSFLPIWVFLYLALRLALLWTNPESLFWPEELYQGTIAKEILSGNPLPLSSWQGGSHEGGTLWVGLAAVPFFALFGPNYFALKLVPISFGLISLLLSYFFLLRHFSLRAANIAGALITFSSPVFTKLGMLAIGTHSDSAFLWIAALWSFYEFKKSRSSIFLFICGLASGLGIGYAYILGIGVLSLLISWFLTARRSFLSLDFLFFAAGFLMGYAPSLFYHFHHNWEGFAWVRDTLKEGSWNETGFKGKDFVEKIFFLITNGLRLCFGFEIKGLLSHFIAGAYILGIWLNKKSDQFLPFIVYPVLFSIAYALSPWDPASIGASFFSFRYYAPLQWMLLLGAAIGLAGISLSWLRRCLLGVILSLGFLGQIVLIRHGDAKSPLVFRGYSYRQLGAAWANVETPFPEKYTLFKERAAKIDSKHYARLYAGYFNLGYITLAQTAPVRLKQEIHAQLQAAAPLERRHLERLLAQLNEQDS